MSEATEGGKGRLKIVAGAIGGAVTMAATLLGIWQFFRTPTPKLVVETQRARFEMPPQRLDWSTAADPLEKQLENDGLDWDPFDPLMDEFYEGGRVRHFYSVSVTNDGTAEAEGVSLKVGGTGMFTVTKEGRSDEKNPLPLGKDGQIDLGSLPIGDNATVRIWRAEPPSEVPIRLRHKTWSQLIEFDSYEGGTPSWIVWSLSATVYFMMASQLWFLYRINREKNLWAKQVQEEQADLAAYKARFEKKYGSLSLPQPVET